MIARTSRLALLVATCGACSAVPDVVFTGLRDATSDVPADHVTDVAIDRWVKDAGSDATDATVEGSIDDGSTADVDLDADTDAVGPSGCPVSRPPNATTCCGTTPCNGNCTLTNCQKCLLTCLPSQLCCVKMTNAVCRELDAASCP